MTKSKEKDSKTVKKAVKKTESKKTKAKENKTSSRKRQSVRKSISSERFTEENVLAAIKGCRTIVSTVAKRLHCDWWTADKYIKNWESTRLAYEAEKQMSLDMAESALFQNVDNGDVGAIKYFLSKKAKERGYGDEENAMEDQEEGKDNVFRIVDESPIRACDTGEFD